MDNDGSYIIVARTKAKLIAALAKRRAKERSLIKIFRSEQPQPDSRK